MRVIRIVCLMLGMALSAWANVRSGRASAEWVSASSAFEAGSPLQTAIRLSLDDGWHTYWLNPGDGGMKTSVEWELPAGWTAEIAHPVPKRFQTGGLSGFGYEGTVLFPVTLTPPADVAGPVVLEAKVSWLTCNDDSCVPGNAELPLKLDVGPLKPTVDAEAIRDAFSKVPRPQKEWVRLDVREKPAVLALSIEIQAGRELDLSRCEVFPATANVIDPGAVFRFVRNDSGGWIAEAPKSEYVTGTVKELTLVLAGEGLKEPIELKWQKP